MYAITGITGRVGGAAARALLKGGHPVRAVLRDKAKAGPWEAVGAEIAFADIGDAKALAKAFAGTEGVFAMIPPYFAPQPGYPEATAISATLAEALTIAAPPRVVALSSVGAHRASGLGLITQIHILEQALRPLASSTAILRPGWFMENSAWDIAPARETGAMASFLSPLDKPFPMIATADVGRVAADTLLQNWTGQRVIEIEGPKRYSQHDIAALLGVAVGRAVTAQAVPRDLWETLFQSQGTAWPAPRIAMLDGFNSGWIDFEGGRAEHVIGQTPYESVLADLVRQGT